MEFFAIYSNGKHASAITVKSEENTENAHVWKTLNALQTCACSHEKTIYVSADT